MESNPGRAAFLVKLNIDNQKLLNYKIVNLENKKHSIDVIVYESIYEILIWKLEFPEQRS